MIRTEPVQVTLRIAEWKIWTGYNWNVPLKASDV